MPNPAAKKKRLHCSVQQCGYSTFSWTDLSRHRRKHTGEKPYQCDKCDKKYSRQDKLVIHKRVHDGRRPFRCPHCKYTTVDNSNLRKHVRSHTGFKPYKCNQCPYATNAPSQLVVHIRKHTGDSPYLCMVESCGAAFKTSSDFKRHLRGHTGEKPFKCLHCNFEAAVKSNLSTHIKKHHGNHSLPQSESGTAIHGQVTQEAVVQTAQTSKSNGNGSVIIMPKIPRKRIRKPKRPKDASQGELKNESSKVGFACQHCKYKVTRLKTLELHIRRKHKDIVEKGDDADTNTHIVIKEGVSLPDKSGKSFTCSTCSASFVQDKSLKCHMRQHITPIPISVQPAPSPIVISVIAYADSSGRSNPKKT